MTKSKSINHKTFTPNKQKRNHKPPCQKIQLMLQLDCHSKFIGFYKNHSKTDEGGLQVTHFFTDSFHRLRGTETNPQTITTTNNVISWNNINLFYNNFKVTIRLWQIVIYSAKKTTSKMLKTVEKHTKKLSSWAQNAIISHYIFVFVFLLLWFRF